MARGKTHPLRRLAYHAADEALREGSSRATLGRARLLGQGLDYVAFLVDVERPAAPEHEDLAQVVVRVPCRRFTAGQQGRAHTEVRLLAYLAKKDLPFRVPLVLAHKEYEGHLVMVQDACHGMELRGRARDSMEPWAVIGPVAAAVHGLAAMESDLDAVLPPCGRSEHLAARLTDVGQDAPAMFDTALAFIDEHLPEEQPGVLLHGDLLPQNIQVDVLGRDPPAVLDWSRARHGHPAHDLAVVTRGVRRPFQSRTGRALLLDAYNAISDSPVTLLELRMHELLLRMGVHAQLVADGESDAACEQESKFVNGLLREARAAAKA